MDGLPYVLAEDEMEWLGRVGFLNDPRWTWHCSWLHVHGHSQSLCLGKVAIDNWTGVFSRLQLQLECRVFADANWKSHMKTKSLDPRRSMRRAFERNIVELQEAFLCNGQAQIGFSAMSQAHRSDGWRLVVALSHFPGLGTPWVYGGWVLPFIPKGRGHSRPELS